MSSLSSSSSSSSSSLSDSTARRLRSARLILVAVPAFDALARVGRVRVGGGEGGGGCSLPRPPLRGRALACSSMITLAFRGLPRRPPTEGTASESELTVAAATSPAASASSAAPSPEAFLSWAMPLFRCSVILASISSRRLLLTSCSGDEENLEKMALKLSKMASCVTACRKQGRLECRLKSDRSVSVSWLRQKDRSRCWRSSLQRKRRKLGVNQTHNLQTSAYFELLKRWQSFTTSVSVLRAFSRRLKRKRIIS